MQTNTYEIADRIFRLSTCVPEAAPGGFTFNQFLIDAEDPLLFHTGPRRMFPLVSQAIARIIPLKRLRWIAFGHVESDECGAMNEFLAAAPRAEVAHGVPRAVWYRSTTCAIDRLAGWPTARSLISVASRFGTSIRRTFRTIGKQGSFLSKQPRPFFVVTSLLTPATDRRLLTMILSGPHWLLRRCFMPLRSQRQPHRRSAGSPPSSRGCSRSCTVHRRGPGAVSLFSHSLTRTTR